MKFLISRLKSRITVTEISAGNNEIIELLQNQIIYLREECKSKNQLINLISENVFKNNIPIVTCYSNSNTLVTPDDLVKTTIRKVVITPTLVIIDFMLFLLMRTVKIIMKIYTSQSHHVKYYILTKIKMKNIGPKKVTEIGLLIGKSTRKIFL